MNQASEDLKKSPGGQAQALHDQLDGWLQDSFTQKRLQEQQICGRFQMSRWLANDVAEICYGEAANY